MKFDVFCRISTNIKVIGRNENFVVQYLYQYKLSVILPDFKNSSIIELFFNNYIFIFSDFYSQIYSYYPIYIYHC